MNGDVDIIVRAPSGHRALVASVALSGSFEYATHKLTDYMNAIGADVGLVLSAEAIRILYETYRGAPSIQIVGEYPLALARGLERWLDEVDFADRVQYWLEDIQHDRRPATEPLMAALDEYVAPALAGADIRAAGPRVSAAG